MKISLCLLTWNEIHGCQRVVPELPTNIFSEVFALDGGSTDGTVEYLRSASIRVVKQKQRSYNAAYIEALKHYSGDGIVFYHPKGTVDEASLPLVVDKLTSEFDLVIASRMLPESRNEEDDQFLRHRKWFGVALSHAASIRWNRKTVARVSDPLHGYRGLSRSFAETLALQPTGVTADLEMVRAAYRSGVRVAEVPVDESEREVGGTHFPAYSTGKSLLRYLLTSN